LQFDYFRIPQRDSGKQILATHSLPLYASRSNRFSALTKVTDGEDFYLSMNSSSVR
jgi:hypothetical protein